MTDTRWLFSKDDGQPRYYRAGDYIYSKDGNTEFSVSNAWWYAIKGGSAEYYESGKWVFSKDGQPAFYYG